MRFGRCGQGSDRVRRAQGAVALVICCALTVLEAGCRRELPPGPQVPGGDAAAGRVAIARYGCGTCHVIPGVPRANGIVGPSLQAFARHPYVAGRFPNRPDVLVRWIRDAPSLAPETAMPALGVSEAHARDIAAYLYELR